jgi:hypothetical protein
MVANDDDANLSADQRRREVIAILATGAMRWHRGRGGGTEDQRRLLDGVHQQRRVLQRGGGGNKNFVSGADTALGIDGLTKAEVVFMDLVPPQTPTASPHTGVMPAMLLVPTALSANRGVGTQLYKRVELRSPDTTANTKFPAPHANPHQGKGGFRIEVSRYLSNALYTGNSAKAWYLLADPSDLPVIEMAFLNGQEAPPPPHVETSDADFNMLGIRMRGYHDFGVNLQDPRGGVKSKGEV